MAAERMALGVILPPIQQMKVNQANLRNDLTEISGCTHAGHCTRAGKTLQREEPNCRYYSEFNGM